MEIIAESINGLERRYCIIRYNSSRSPCTVTTRTFDITVLIFSLKYKHISVQPFVLNLFLFAPRCLFSFILGFQCAYRDLIYRDIEFFQSHFIVLLKLCVV